MSATTVTVPGLAGTAGRGVAGRLRSLWRGPARDPAWARPGLLGLLAVTGVLYLFNLSRNAYANDFYAAAVQAGHPLVEGVLLRFVRLIELHHRGQDARLAVGR